jgi:hypothetical protein
VLERNAAGPRGEKTLDPRFGRRVDRIRTAREHAAPVGRQSDREKRRGLAARVGHVRLLEPTDRCFEEV